MELIRTQSTGLAVVVMEAGLGKRMRRSSQSAASCRRSGDGALFRGARIARRRRSCRRGRRSSGGSGPRGHRGRHDGQEGCALQWPSSNSGTVGDVGSCIAESFECLPWARRGPHPLSHSERRYTVAAKDTVADLAAGASGEGATVTILTAVLDDCERLWASRPNEVGREQRLADRRGSGCHGRRKSDS